MQEPTSINPSGIAHIQLSLSTKHWNESVVFYKQWLNKLYRMEVILDNESTLYCVGAKTGVAKTRCDEVYEHETFNQRRIGLHHICFRMRSKEDVCKTYDFLIDYNKKQKMKSSKAQLNILRAPKSGVWAPGYYSILFEDFDGIRWECNFVPNKGWLDPKYKHSLPHNAPFSKL